MDFFSRFKTVESDGFLFCSLTIKELFVNCETLYIREEEYYEDTADQFDKANAFPNVKNLIVHHVACFDNGMLGFPKLESLHLHLSWELLDSHWGKLIRSVKHLTFTADKHSQGTIIPEHCDDVGSFGDSCLQTLSFEGYHFNPIPFLASVYNLKKVHTLSFINLQAGETDLQIDGTHTPNLSTLMVERSEGLTSFKLQLQSLEKLIHLKTSNVSKIYIERCYNLQTMKTFKPNDDFGMLRLEADSLPHLRQLSYMEATMIDIPDLNCDVDVQKMIRRSHKRGFEDD